MRPQVLSTGEQQRVAFARVFLDRPKMLFLDEASARLTIVYPWQRAYPSGLELSARGNDVSCYALPRGHEGALLTAGWLAGHKCAGCEK